MSLRFITSDKPTRNRNQPDEFPEGMNIMRERMEKALRKSDAEFAEIRIEKATSSWVTFRGEDLDSIGSKSHP